MPAKSLRTIGPERLLYLREEELDQAVDLFFLASRRFWRTAENALTARNLGPAHYRALAAIRRMEPPPSVTQLRERLGVRKQSLARVLDGLERAGLVAKHADARDARQRKLVLTEAGRIAERDASAALRERLAQAFRTIGDQSVPGALALLEALTEEKP
ncbi:MAG: MarR family transcriptional regulator [Hyphomonadaceae bacterium]|nr:MarR family transcriptional regulator [Hyphomonadaceae bacterium]